MANGWASTTLKVVLLLGISRVQVTCVEATIFEKVAFGLGLQSCQDGNGCAAGWDWQLSQQQSQLRAVGSPVLGKFWVFGR